MLVIWPKLAPEPALLLGNPKLGWLSALKASPAELQVPSFAKWPSSCPHRGRLVTTAGPTSVFFPTFPKVPGAIVRESGSVEIALQPVRPASSYARRLIGPGTTSARSPYCKDAELLLSPLTMVKGRAGLCCHDAGCLPAAEYLTHQEVVASECWRGVDEVGDGDKRNVQIGNTTVETKAEGIR